MTIHISQAMARYITETFNSSLNDFEKNSATLIASDDSITVSNTGNPGMASGGMGDVLSGVIAGLVAQGLSLQEAAQQGAYGHGFAADKAVKIDGERGLLASDLFPHLRRWVNR